MRYVASFAFGLAPAKKIWGLRERTEAGRAPSTVSREVSRNGGDAAYQASNADSAAWERALRPKLCRLVMHPALRWVVAQKLALEWSPEQIAGWLKRTYPHHEGLQVSHESLYRSLFVQTRGVLKKELIAHLRTGRNIRQPKGGTTKLGLGSLVDAVSIRERPAEAQDRAVPDHWEGDLLCGANNSYIATLVERQTRFAMLIKIAGRDTATVVGALSQHVQKQLQELRRSLTWDRGKEMADHKKFTVATDVQVYFCDRATRGSAAATRTPTVGCASIPRAAPIYRSTLKHISIALRCGSTSVPERPWASRRRPIDCKQCCTDLLNSPPKPVTARPCYATLTCDCAYVAVTATDRTNSRRTRLVVQRQHFVVLLGGDLHHARTESGRVRLDVGVGTHRINTLHCVGQWYAARPHVSVGE